MSTCGTSPPPAVYVRDGDREWPIYFNTPEHEAMLEWARFHGLDPMRIPIKTVIERDAEARCIRYVEFLYDPPHDKRPENLVIVDDYDVVHVSRVEQGEGPPLPLPLP